MGRMGRIAVILILSALAVSGAYAADTKAGALQCVGLYSETSDGQISYRVGSGSWVVIGVGDMIPAGASIRVNVERDWAEFIAPGKAGAVWEIAGSDTGEVIKTVAEILKSKPRAVALPKGTKAKPDPKFANKLVVTQYLGRQVSLTPDYDSKDIKYGDVLEKTWKVKIIGINNTLTLMNAGGAVTTVIGPLNFDVEKVLTNQNLYKYLNVQK